jgi:salicylate hydroxylase
MTPMGGVGANTALRDADALRRALAGHLTCGCPLEHSVAGYEQRMRTYANEALAMSTRNAASGARLPRLAFTTLLQLAETIPPVKRAMFEPAPTPTV